MLTCSQYEISDVLRVWQLMENKNNYYWIYDYLHFWGLCFWNEANRCYLKFFTFLWDRFVRPIYHVWILPIQVLFIEKSWGEYFTDPYHKNYENQNTALPDASGNYLITNCNFKDVGSTGVIRFENPGKQALVLHEKCYYLNCYHNSQNGGCFYFQNGCECIQEGITSSKCYSNSQGQCSYAYLDSTNPASNRNFLMSSSIDLCSFDKDDAGDYPIYLLYGIIQVSSINITNCKSDSTAALYIYYFYKQSFLRLSNFVGNTVTMEYSGNSNSITYFNICKDNSNFTVNQCSYFNNTQLKDGGRLISCYQSSIIISQCCISNNSLTKTFLIDEGSSILVYENFIDKTDSEAGTINTFDEIKITEKCFFRWSGISLEEKQHECNCRCSENFFKSCTLMMNFTTICHIFLKT